MSHEATNWAYKLDLPMSQKFVLIALADRADEQHSCFPGQKSLAEMVGSSVETVRRALIGLEHTGLIRRERRNRASGYRTSDRYVLSVGSLPVNLPTRQSAYKADSGSLPVNARILTGQSEGANEPSVEPSVEPSEESPVSCPSAEQSKEFDQWYSTYPKKEAKGAAKKAFKTARKKTDLQTLIDGVARYKKSIDGQDPKFTPLPASWLNAERWEDERPSGNQSIPREWRGAFND